MSDTGLSSCRSTDLDKTKRNSRKFGGRPLSQVWEHFLKGPEIKNNKGHYSARCDYCSKHFEVGYPNVLEKHLARECVQCDEEIHNHYLNLIMEKNKSRNIQKNAHNSISNKKNLNNRQVSLSEFYEHATLTKEREESINKSLIHAFVMAGIPYSTIENPYFVEFLKKL